MKREETTGLGSCGKQPSTGAPEHLPDLFAITMQNVPAEYQESISQLLKDFSDIFLKGSFDIGRTDYVQHIINTGDTPPFRQAHRRYPARQREREDTERQVRDLLQHGLIEPSSSPWASNVVLVSKTDGSKLFCVDYR
ncbi:uncharacterized protein LOC121417644 [Lytechinus variegatus]|uniref:uncharacterized protein LOC121417644 n=1 Tax=Lytechinus variegatus TaxID=7654 RepID=UPI001BB18694|nr:uncharacterized protein LOC121417644 [Lytechinus variegatus]